MSVGNLEMDMTLKTTFPGLWGRNFDNAELPIIYYYTDEENRADGVSPPSAHQCMIGALARVRKGRSLRFEADSIGCAGGRRYAGFSREISPTFYVPKETLTFAVPMKKFIRMTGNMEESFLITRTWRKVKKRMA